MPRLLQSFIAFATAFDVGVTVAGAIAAAVAVRSISVIVNGAVLVVAAAAAIKPSTPIAMPLQRTDDTLRFTH